MLIHLSYIWLFETIWTANYQAPLSIGFCRQEYWSGLPCPPRGHLPWMGAIIWLLRSPEQGLVKSVEGRGGNMATQPVPASREGAPTALVGAARSLILSPLLPVLPPHPTPHPELSPRPQPKTLHLSIVLQGLCLLDLIPSIYSSPPLCIHRDFNYTWPA